MRNIGIISADVYEEKIENNFIPEFTKEDYEDRINVCISDMKQKGLTHIIVYADREHSANMEYFTGYDPRFEEALLILGVDGEKTLIVGNEGWGYSFISPLDLNRVKYQNFSLQGQPRESLRALKDIYRDCGITKSSRVGIIGLKYYGAQDMLDGERTFDIPYYMVKELADIVGMNSVTNVTSWMTNPADGYRIILKTAKEIAYYEYASCKTSNAVINMIKNLKPGISELELSKSAMFDASPTNVHPMINFGKDHVSIGLRSPDYSELREVDLITLVYGIKGALVARSGLVCYKKDEMTDALRESIESFYKPYFEALVEWYEALKIGESCGVIYEKVMNLIGDERFGVYLNPGHNIAMEEWPNTPFYKNSEYKIQSGYYIQSDIIASSKDPFVQAIMEDGVIIADESLRARLKAEFPKVYENIQKRRKFIKEIIGINLSEEVLPLSNCQAVFHPFMSDASSIFAVLN